MRHDGNSDVDGHDLYMELMILKCLLVEAKRAINVLNYSNKINGCNPNANAHYTILLTILIKVHLREKFLQVEVD